MGTQTIVDVIDGIISTIDSDGSKHSYDISDTIRCYNGKAHYCCCGCSGTYVDVNTRAGKMRKKKAMGIIADNTIEEISIGKTYMHVISKNAPNRCIIMYK